LKIGVFRLENIGRFSYNPKTREKNDISRKKGQFLAILRVAKNRISQKRDSHNSS